MINPVFHGWLRARSDFQAFKKTTIQTDDALQAQAGVELVLRFVSFRLVPYQQGLDVHEYLDKSLIQLAKDGKFPAETETDVFERTFALLDNSLGSDAFKRWNGERFLGAFLMSVFEVIAIGGPSVSIRLSRCQTVRRSSVSARRSCGITWYSNRTQGLAFGEQLGSRDCFRCLVLTSFRNETPYGVATPDCA